MIKLFKKKKLIKTFLNKESSKKMKLIIKFLKKE